MFNILAQIIISEDEPDMCADFCCGSAIYTTKNSTYCSAIAND